MKEAFDRTHALAELMCTAALRPLFVTQIEADEENGRDVANIRAGWVGGVPDSQANFFGPAKAFELLATAPTTGTTLTPTGADFGCGYKGGIRQDNIILSASDWSQMADLLFALALRWSHEHEVRFHHVGIRHKTREARDASVAADETLYGREALFLPTNHERHYIRVLSEQAPNGVFWVEHQLWGEGSEIPGLHWDVATTPRAFLSFHL